MFGKLSRIMIYAVIGAGVLVFSTQVLSIAVDMAIALQYGEYASLVFLGLLAVICLRLSKNADKERSIPKMIAKIIGSFSMILIVFVVFLANLRSGVFVGLLSGTMVLGVIYVMTNTSDVVLLAKDVFRGTIKVPLKGTNRTQLVKQVISSKNRLVYLIPSNYWEKMIEILRVRPLLPVALVHLHEEDILVVNSERDSKWGFRIERLLHESKILGFRKASLLTVRIALSLPILVGIDKIDDYVIVSDREHVDRLIKEKSVLMSVHPHKDGPRVILPNDDAVGMEVSHISGSQSVYAVITRDISRMTEEVVEIAD